MLEVSEKHTGYESKHRHMGHVYKDLNIVIKNQNLMQSTLFIWEQTSAQKRQIRIARAAFQALGKVWSARDITTTTKLQVYETLVLSCLLYNSETWTMKCSSEQRLNVFEMACLRRILGVT